MSAHPTSSIPRGSSLLVIGLLSSILGVLYYMYHFFGVTDVGYDIQDTTRSAFHWIFERWRGDWRATLYASSQWIPFASLLLIWLDRRTLASLPRRINRAGFLLIVAALALHWAGVKAQQTRLTILSMIALAWSIPLFTCGWPVARRLLIPCGFLIFMLPLNFFDAAAYPLRIIAASAASVLLNGLGILVEHSGSIIRAGNVSLNLADQHSGIFAVSAALAFSIFCAGLMRAPWWTRIMIVGASIPLLVLGNIARAILAVLVAKIIDDAAGVVFFGRISGAVVCFVTFGITGIASWWLHQRNPATDRTHPGAAQVNGRQPVYALMLVLLLVTAAAAWIPTNLHIRHDEDADISLDWPSSLGVWQGANLLYCHNPAQPQEVIGESLTPEDPCPSCGQPLFALATIEKSLLPPDTVVMKKQYTRSPGGDRLQLAVVLSGQYRSSIHRPEVCLVGPNREIVQSTIHPVTLANGKVLEVRLLDMLMHDMDAQGGKRAIPVYFAYWFTGSGKETPSHIQRMIWMASDRLFRNRSSRWAYLSISGIRDTESGDHLRKLDEFIRNIHPYLNPEAF